jgi:trehalose 6-phosphate phosphatase
MKAVGHFDQLRSHPDSVARPPHAPFEQMLDVQPPADFRKLAIHFRKAPYLEEKLRLRLCALLARTREYELIEGDHVIEIKPTSRNKATAIEAFMQEAPFAGRMPVYIGDDVTDSDGFAAVRRFSGKAISVGDRVTADRHLENPTAVREWLETLLLEAPRRPLPHRAPD